MCTHALQPHRLAPFAIQLSAITKCRTEYTRACVAPRLWNEQGMRWLLVTVRIVSYAHMLIVFVVFTLPRAAGFWGGIRNSFVFFKNVFILLILNPVSDSLLTSLFVKGCRFH